MPDFFECMIHGMKGDSRTRLESQRHFYGLGDSRSRIRPDRRRSTLRHLEEMLAVLELEPGARILEMGCGMGRFSLLLADRGYKLTANDLSADLLSTMEKRDPGNRIHRLCCDAAAINLESAGMFDAVLGFFFLHHLDDLEPVIQTAARVLRPEGKMAFCEPNALNPLFPIQILLSPSMKWTVDKGVLRMRQKFFHSAFDAAGIEGPRIRRYGFFPRSIANSGLGSSIERGMESLRIFSPLSAFQIISGRKNA